MTRHYALLLLLSLLIVFEVLGLTWLQTDATYYLSSWIYFFSGLGICLLTFYFAINSSPDPAPGTLKPSPALLVGIGVFVLLFVYTLIAVNKTIARVPIDWRLADMLPQIKASCTKFLNGEKVYAPVNEIWGGQHNPYLPAMWLPFVPSIALGFDMRYTTFALFFTGVLLSIFLLGRAKGIHSFLAAFISFAALGLLVTYYIECEHNFWAMTQEGLIVFYYLLLIVSLYSRNFIFVGISIMLCALSRYSLSFFVPAFFIMTFFAAEKKGWIKLTLTSAIVFAAIFFVPFFLADPAYFMSMPQMYLGKSDDYWRAHDYSTQSVMGPGLFKFFAYRDIHIMQKLQYAATLLAPFTAMGVYLWLKKKTQPDFWLWSMGMLKITLLFFYNLLVLPFPYLFIVPVLISFPILYSVLAKQKQLQT